MLHENNIFKPLKCQYLIILNRYKFVKVIVIPFRKKTIESKLMELLDFLTRNAHFHNKGSFTKLWTTPLLFSLLYLSLKAKKSVKNNKKWDFRCFWARPTHFFGFTLVKFHTGFIQLNRFAKNVGRKPEIYVLL